MNELETEWNNKFIAAVGKYNHVSVLGILEAVKTTLCEVCLHSGPAQFDINLGEDLDFAITIVELCKEGVSSGIKPVTMIALIDRFVINSHIVFFGTTVH